VALCVALVQLAKKLGFPEKYAPALATIIGIGEGLLVYWQTDPIQGVVLGIAAGLSAVGLWSGTKNIQEGMKKNGKGD
jgi:hypothetical protein